MSTNLDEELKAIHQKILAVGNDVSAENLSKALVNGETLTKAKTPPPPPDDEEEDYSDDDEEGEEGDDEDYDDENDEGDDEEEEEAPAMPPARAKKSMQGRRGRADEEFLKSLLLDERDKRTPMSRVIEATPVLSHMSDAFAKSLGSMDERLEQQQAHASSVELMVKSLVIAVIDLKKEVKRLTKSNNARVTTNPPSGMNYALNSGLPNTQNRGDAKALSKSRMGDIIQIANERGQLDNEATGNALLTLDSSGPEAALAYIDDDELRDAIRKYSEIR